MASESEREKYIIDKVDNLDGQIKYWEGQALRLCRARTLSACAEYDSAVNEAERLRQEFKGYWPSYWAAIGTPEGRAYLRSKSTSDE
jgi:hypothetical protein